MPMIISVRSGFVSVVLFVLIELLAMRIHGLVE